MKTRYTLAHAILWATAIIAAALCDAPAIVCEILLPALAVMALRMQGPQTCFKRRTLP